MDPSLVEVNAVVQQLVTYVAASEATDASTALLDELAAYQRKCWATQELKVLAKRNSRRRRKLPPSSGRRTPRSQRSSGGKSSAMSRAGLFSGRRSASSPSPKPSRSKNSTYPFATLDLAIVGNPKTDAQKKWFIQRLAELSRLQIETAMREARGQSSRTRGSGTTADVSAAGVGSAAASVPKATGARGGAGAMRLSSSFIAEQARLSSFSSGRGFIGYRGSGRASPVTVNSGGQGSEPGAGRHRAATTGGDATGSDAASKGPRLLTTRSGVKFHRAYAVPTSTAAPYRRSPVTVDDEGGAGGAAARDSGSAMHSSAAGGGASAIAKLKGAPRKGGPLGLRPTPTHDVGVKRTTNSGVKESANHGGLRM